MALADDWPIRSNGQDIEAGWFNTARTIMLGILGAESTQQESFSGSASQTGSNVTGAIWDKTVTRMVKVEFTVVTATLFAGGNFHLFYNDTIWTYYEGENVGDISGITFDVNTSTGQLEYDSGAETFVLEYKAEAMNI